MNCKQYILIISGVILISALTGCRQLLEGPNDPGFIQTDLDPVEKIVASSPVKGDIYEPGEAVQIKWITSNSSISYIDKYLYRKSVLKRAIANSFVNQGSYTWHIHHVIDYSNHYTVKIVNSNNPEVFNYSGQFGILKNN